MGYADLDELCAHWNAFASLFAEAFEQSTAILAHSLFEHLCLAQARAVLEVGAGPGLSALALLQLLPPDARLVVTDIAPSMVALARARLPEQVGVMTANAENLPFASGSFDRLLSNLCLNLVLDADRALAEAHRVLSPGGLAAWSVWGRPALSPMFTLPVQAAERAGITLPATRSNFHLGDRNTLRARIQGHGFARVLAWYQTMTMTMRDGASYADLTLRTPRWRNNMAGQPAKRVASFRRELAGLVDDLFAAGEPLALDVLIVVAERP